MGVSWGLFREGEWLIEPPGLGSPLERWKFALEAELFKGGVIGVGIGGKGLTPLRRNSTDLLDFKARVGVRGEGEGVTYSRRTSRLVTSSRVREVGFVKLTWMQRRDEDSDCTQEQHIRTSSGDMFCRRRRRLWAASSAVPELKSESPASLST